MLGGNSAYSPLPQSNSDSDGSSEEELRVPQENRIVNTAGKTQNLKSEKTYNGQKHNAINYKPLDNDGDVGVTLIKFQPSIDGVSVLKPSSNLEKFSISRKICFVISLLLCIFTTVVFIWILPCSTEPCPYTSTKEGYNYTWEESFKDLEIYGPISIVPNFLGRNQSLIFLLRNPLIFGSESDPQNTIMCVHGKNGSLSWNVTLNKQPTDIDCKLMDISGDGLTDCLIYGKNLLKAINSITGQELWDFQDSNQKMKQLKVLDFPLVLPDLDSDKVKDLLLPCSFAPAADHLSVHLVIISGRTGVIIGKPWQIKFCSAIYSLMYENSSTISYTCYNSGKESLQTVDLVNLYNVLKNVSKPEKWEKLNQHQKPSNTVYLNGLRLTVDNQGSCPEDCIVLVEIKDESHKNKIIYSFKHKNTFGITPAVVKSKQEFGFLLKFWEWHSKKPNFENKAEFFIQKMKKIRKRNKLSNSESLDKEMLLESRQQVNRTKRTTLNSYNKQFEKNISSLNLHLINETVIKISFNFNDTRAHVTKLVENEVVQICKKLLPCQPDVLQQKYSTLVADLNEDGTSELVIFTSKYVHELEKTKGGNETWKLHSRIQVINV